ncbi:MAG: hypothetical protein P3A32_03595 [Gemmatimonadota bacterium]|jgi:hypothetical protein|nr:hypothetical protein [Gemmatimonadota bacterium]MDQ8146746.1 hypothetical protein [Gemmatimonadota bacterium]MDQ8148896.1 hypothetical protein [Gemmatimonadota bacterium]MDQ8156843.1 hypothetical protein [Gemmatimonadota bacterium]MDQ8176099.1 hypothetical protein [Gemmatimonadota bacterium]
MILAIHNILRWAVLLTGLLALVQAARGLDGRTPFAKTRPLLLAFTANLHLQLLLGLALFVVSPTVKAYMADMAGTMRDGSRRFFIAEHPTLMVAAVLLATIGGVVAKNAADDAARHRRALVFTVITMLVLLAGIPWSRPLLPSF